MLTACGGGTGGSAIPPLTPILGRTRTPGIVFATESPADFNGLEGTLRVLTSS